MSTSVLLVRWHGGWHEVDSGLPDRREALLGLGAVQSVGELERIANRQLDVFSDQRTEITVGLAPVDDTDTPYLAFTTGDTVTVPDEAGAPTSERVMAITVTEDEEGIVTFVPVMRDVILDEQARFAQAIKKMSNGTIGGHSKVATPAAQISTAGRDCCPPQPHVGTV